MKANMLKEMLLISEPSILKLYDEMMNIAGLFIAPVFLIALLLEYFGEMNFGEVVKKLFLITIFMSIFYQIHTKAVDIAFESAQNTLTKISPRNLFIKKWYYTKVKTHEKKEWNLINSFAIPNLNDIVATSFYILAKAFLWLLKLIYSSVYHLTYVFSGITAVLYFLGWAKDALKGTVQASLWCMILPFILIAILALVGNGLEEPAIQGELMIAKMDTLIWLLGVTLLLLLTPAITYSMVKGEGIHSFGAKMGSMVVSSGMKAAAMVPFMMRQTDRLRSVTQNVGAIREKFQTTLGKQSEKSKDHTEKKDAGLQTNNSQERFSDRKSSSSTNKLSVASKGNSSPQKIPQIRTKEGQLQNIAPSVKNNANYSQQRQPSVQNSKIQEKKTDFKQNSNTTRILSREQKTELRQGKPRFIKQPPSQPNIRRDRNEHR